jgi:hypothetical protein
MGPLLARLSDAEMDRFRRECSRRLEDQRITQGFELVKRVDFTIANRT